MTDLDCVPLHLLYIGKLPDCNLECMAFSLGLRPDDLRHTFTFLHCRCISSVSPIQHRCVYTFALQYLRLILLAQPRVGTGGPEV